MSDKGTSDSRTGPWRNWLSFAGLVVAFGSFFAFLLLFTIDLTAKYSNPYMGILAYVIAPTFLFLGIGMFAAGVWWQRRHERRMGLAPRPACCMWICRGPPTARNSGSSSSAV
jgi:hypothetical protein